MLWLFVGAAEAAKPAAHDPRLHPQSRQRPAPQHHTMAINTTAARSPASRLASLPQKTGAALAVAVVGAAGAAKPAARDPRLLPHSGKSTAAPNGGDQHGRCKVTGFATPVAPTQAKAAAAFVGAASAVSPVQAPHPNPEAQLLIGKNARPCSAKTSILSTTY